MDRATFERRLRTTVAVWNCVTTADRLVTDFALAATERRVASCLVAEGGRVTSLVLRLPRVRRSRTTAGAVEAAVWHIAADAGLGRDDASVTPELRRPPRRGATDAERFFHPHVELETTLAPDAALEVIEALDADSIERHLGG